MLVMAIKTRDLNQYVNRKGRYYKPITDERPVLLQRLDKVELPMGLKQLDELLRPRSIAVIGASNQEHRPGNTVMRKLLQGGFDGPIMPVTPN